MWRENVEMENEEYVLLLCEEKDALRKKKLLEGAVREEPEKMSILKMAENAEEIPGNQEACLSYGQLWQLDMNELVGIIMPSAWIRRIGLLNHRLGKSGELGENPQRAELYELVLRAAVEFGESHVVYDRGIQKSGVKAGEKCGEAYLFAYLIRYHMNALREQKLLDPVFQNVCMRMQTKDCFQEFQSHLDRFLSDQDAFERIARETAPYLILRGNDTCGGVLQHFADDLADALARCGQAVWKLGHEEWNGRDSETDRDSLPYLRNTPLKGIVGFQAAALEADFFKALHGPKFQFWLDYPFHFEKGLRNLPTDHYVLCQDSGYAELIRTYFHTENSMQLPPGGIDLGEPDWTEERPLDIIFIGEYFSYDIEELNAEERRLFDEILKNPLKRTEEIIQELYYPVEDEKLPALCLSMKRVRRTAIAYYREKVMETILKAGYTVHVYGAGWFHYQGESGEGLIRHPQISVDEAMSVLRRAKISLNIMSWHKDGMTERVANSMLSGAVCLTEETSYLREHMHSGEDVQCFRLDRLEELPTLIGRLLRDEGYRLRVAKNAYRKAREKYSWDACARSIIRLSNEHDEKDKSIKIFVATHVKFQPPANPIYIPLHVGRKGKQDLGYLGDDTGENISDLNFLYGELTGLFWIWQNVQDVDYVGLCHYRRYFISDQKKELRKEEYLKLLQSYDAIVPKHAECEAPSYYEHYGRAHNSRDLDAVSKALKRLYPEYGPAYDQAMSGRIFYWGNLVVTELSILKAYAEWLFTIFLEAGEEIDVSNYDDYHKRVYGFLSEQMFYVFALANGLRLCETSVGISAEKAETEELKKMLKGLIVEGKRGEALLRLNQALEKRPDLLLAGSDINGELNQIYRELTGE